MARAVRDARSASAPPPLTDEDCRTCGACCAPEIALPFYVGLRPRDLARLSDHYRARHVARGSLLTRIDDHGRCVCVALRGTIGSGGSTGSGGSIGSVGGKVSCRIYERRPDECRKLTPGDDECRKARAQAGLG